MIALHNMVFLPKGADKALDHAVIDRQADRRNYGIDLLRLFSMFMVVVLHVLNRGGILANAQGPSYLQGWLAHIAAYAAVDCFGLISGYVGFTKQEKPFHYRKFVSFWLQVFIYNFGITLLFYLLKLPSQNQITLKTLIKSAFPILTGYYWYVRAYVGLFFVIPWLNKLIRNLSKKEFTLLVVILVGLAAFGSLKDTFELNNGKSFAWLVFLYIIGAWIKNNEIFSKLKTGVWFLILFGCVILIWLWRIFSPVLPVLFINNTRPSILLTAVCMVCIFSRLSFKTNVQKLIRFFAPAAFGVYLIHVHFIIWDYYFLNAFSWIASSSPLLFLPLVLGCATGIFMVCLLIDVLRLRLFKLMRVDSIINRISGSLGK